ncbi:nucleotidyltransferase family protein [Parabacteroides distasonis]|uniref:nucleotidyltransferase family protein n=1 Tax=Parabacteroides distasonis TaxID=823 RepID=UPI0018AA186F|nr:nucleotidyltransferase domain-containing protein [Parabacteroides distasonis]MDB9027767.1 nucleotidyltransferase domain-containing protein [Parabacteroides distasonis]MDB9044548.1 nucleotidyltransferase domain-containing protein [Parabacteroides distasonis]MDB9091161.1 nucleotidyltransferase domain-containing protein [Parabacteroides distasonis]MDB9162743.1 nucleotidyltransferase domain-containing protein [Parabacteroides distasonis]
MVQWGRLRSGLLVQEWGGGLRQGRRFASGFVLTNRFTEKSDIDLVVDFDKEVEQVDYVNNFFDLRDALSAIFHREIDLLEDKSIRNPILRKNIDNTKLLIYG